MTIVGILILAVASFAQAVKPVRPVEPPVSIGFIEELFGPVSIRANSKAKPIALDARRDVARRVFAGEQVQCGRGGILRLRRNGIVERIRCPSGWTTLKRLVSPQAKAAEMVMSEYGRSSGGTRSGATGVDLFEPSDRGMAIPDGTIRWSPMTDRRTISLVITDSGRREIWRQDRVDGRPGVLTSADLREVLLSYRVQHDRPLTLTLIDPDQKQRAVTFNLLSEDNEKKLKEELARWDHESGRVMPRLGRAEVFARNHMFAQAAAEYDAALRSVPVSLDLLVKAIDAHREAGDFKGAAELEVRLASQKLEVKSQKSKVSSKGSGSGRSSLLTSDF